MKNSVLFVSLVLVATLGPSTALKCHSCVFYEGATASDACDGPFDNGSDFECDPNENNSILQQQQLGIATATANGTKAVGDYMCVTIAGSVQTNPALSVVFRGCAVQDVEGNVDGACTLTKTPLEILGFGFIAQGAKRHMCTTDGCNTLMDGATRECSGEIGRGNGAASVSLSLATLTLVAGVSQFIL